MLMFYITKNGVYYTKQSLKPLFGNFWNLFHPRLANLYFDPLIVFDDFDSGLIARESVPDIELLLESSDSVKMRILVKKHTEKAAIGRLKRFREKGDLGQKYRRKLLMRHEHGWLLPSIDKRVNSHSQSPHIVHSSVIRLVWLNTRRCVKHCPYFKKLDQIHLEHLQWSITFEAGLNGTLTDVLTRWEISNFNLVVQVNQEIWGFDVPMYNESVRV